MRVENKMAGNKGSVGAKSVGGKSKPAGSGSGGNANAKSIQSRSQRAGLQVGHSSFYAVCGCCVVGVGGVFCVVGWTLVTDNFD